MKVGSRAAASVAVLALALACGGPKPEEAQRAVRTYLDRLVEAYRVSDASLMDPLVSEEHALKLTGLIGVKRDAGIVLDAKLLSLEFVRTALEGDRWVVETRERWAYCDRRIGTGEQVGEASTDAYGMRYRLARKDGRWILDTLEFAEPPQVGRKSAPMVLDTRRAHGLPPRDEAPPEPAPAPAGPPAPKER